MKGYPPKRALQFLRWFCHEDYIDEIEGDLIELYKKQYANSPRLAQSAFVWRVIKYFRPEFLKSFRNYQPNSYDMYKSHLRVALRNLQRHRSFTFINVAGL